MLHEAWKVNIWIRLALSKPAILLYVCDNDSCIRMGLQQFGQQTYENLQKKTRI